MSDLAESLEPSVPQAEIDAAAAELPKTDEAQAEPEKKEEVQPEKLVRLEALHEERGKRKKLAEEVAQLRASQAQRDALLEQRFQQLYQQAQPQNQVDPNDPIAVQKQELEQHRAYLQQLDQQRQYEAAQRQQNVQVQQLVGWAHGQVEEFKKEAPDFDDAYRHVIGMRQNMLKAMGLPQDQLRAALERDELWVYSEAARTGRNPGEIVYDMAKQTGFTGKASEQKMETLQKGVQASKGLGAGGVSGGRPTPEQIAGMSESEFEAFKKSLKGKPLSGAL